MISVPGTSQRRVDAFDGLRAIACLGVFYCHAGNDIVIPPVVIRGNTGVHLFFVLSGYLLFAPFLRSLVAGTAPPATGRFYVRRFLRIYPPYAVALAVFVAMRVVLRVHVPAPTNVLTHALLVFNYGDPSTFFSINAAFWTLAIEAQYYLALPAVVWVAAKLGGRSEATAWGLVAALMAIGIGSRLAEFQIGEMATVPPDADLVRFRTLASYLDLFAFGMLAALVELRAGDRLRRSRPARVACIVTGIALYLAANYWSYASNARMWMVDGQRPFVVSYPVLICAGFALILLAAAARPEGDGGLLTWRPLVWVGRISYSVYLYHIGVEYACNRLLPLASLADRPYLVNLLHALIALPPTLMISAAMYYAVERPSLGWIARLRTAPAPAPASAPARASRHATPVATRD